MLKPTAFNNIFVLGLLTFLSCGSDDVYTPLQIVTMPNAYQVFQNISLEMDVLSNDNHVPVEGIITVGNLQNGTVEIVNAGTPNNPSDDVLQYTPIVDFIGSDSFSYTICNGSNCSTSVVTIEVLPLSPVNFNMDEVPYATLSEYHFFEGDLKDLQPVSGVLPYALNSPLFSDYAHKKRFVWMPVGVKASYVNDHSSLNFPVGAVLIKNFYYENVLPDNSTKILETRLMYNTNTGWKFAKYVWNETQTEAAFTTQGSFVNLQWMENNETKTVNYRIPSQSECFTCHNKFGTPLPIGPKPQNLNRDYVYHEGSDNQLNKWIEQNYLENTVPSDIVTTVDYTDESQSLEMRVRSYLDINCAHCHSDESYCEYRPMRFAFNENSDDTNKGICVTPDTQILPYTKIIVPGNANASLVLFRMNSTEEQYRMPLLGRTVTHEEGVRLIENWINSLDYECE